MKNINGWLFLVIALMWLLPLVGVDQLGAIGNWISVVALAVIGIMELKG